MDDVSNRLYDPDKYSDNDHIMMMPPSMIGVNEQIPKFIGGTKFGQNFIEPSSILNSEAAAQQAKYYD